MHNELLLLGTGHAYAYSGHDVTDATTHDVRPNGQDDGDG